MTPSPPLSSQVSTTNTAVTADVGLGGNIGVRRSERRRSQQHQQDQRPSVMSPIQFDAEENILMDIDQQGIFYSGPPRPPRGSGDPRGRLRSFFLNNNGGANNNPITNGDVPFMLVTPPNQRPAVDQYSLPGQTSGYQQETRNPESSTLADPNMMTTSSTTTIRRLNLQTGPDGQTYFTTSSGRSRTSGSTNSSTLRNKIVYNLHCSYCQSHICGRAMRAILLADTKVELYSTDVPPSRLRLLDDDRMTHGCNCRIRDTACQTCGNVMGYHVSQPCERCLEARNNGHFWMFYSETVVASERRDPSANGKPLYWGALSHASDMVDVGSSRITGKPYECYCR